MLMYTTLVLYLRCDLKIAIPTSVIIMAWTSLVGLASNLALGTIEPRSGRTGSVAARSSSSARSLGVFVVSRIAARRPCSSCPFCASDNSSDACQHPRGRAIVTVSLLGVVGANAVFHLVYRAGQRLAARSPHVG